MYKIIFKDDLISHSTIIDITGNAAAELYNISDILYGEISNPSDDIISAISWLNKIIKSFQSSKAEANGITAICVPTCRSYSVRMCEAVYVIAKNIRGNVLTYNIRGFLSMVHYVFTHSKFEPVNSK